ncbi:CarD family transcriptional regulator [Euzebya tangerina]|uniref:CarD family transcriptional regulator n=1 Tax=Euzebya tangerina TaxID=591198 RepID=UPI000E31263A|nr:CarD family transcriptional regulator [Euzebya tangerina]
MTYSVGDTVVYPHHGAAVIEREETRKLLGEERSYLVLRLTYGDLTIKVPADQTDEVGLRNVCDDQEIEEVLDVLRLRGAKVPTNWSRRFKANNEKLKGGDIMKVSEVVRDLSLREMDKGLSAGEKRMLSKARQVLVSELAASLEKEDEEAEAYLDEVLQS